MSKHLERDLENLKRQLLMVGSLVEEAANNAITALIERKPDLAATVMAGDDGIDRAEVDIEEECLKILALHQPVAGDLRFVVAAMKVNNDLERMGDQAVNIAERATYLAKHPPIGVPLDFHRMADVVRAMVRRSLDAHVNQNAQQALGVGAMDDEVDAIHRQMFEVLQERMREDPGVIERAVAHLSASRDLERIADLACNIAEDVVFMVEGKVIRHREA